ncbi:MAG: hypothetical protein Q9160_002673 [Pyrenula sp. 1 TL-2023]
MDTDIGPRERNLSALTDSEIQDLPVYTSENDPFQLSSKLKSQTEINEIKANTSRKRSSKYKFLPFQTIATYNPKSSLNKLQAFYTSQNENIERLLKPVDEHVRQAKETNTANHLRYTIAVYSSFVANVLLAVLQIYGAIASGSLSLFTTMADAIFDPMSNLTLLLSNKAVTRVDARKFPAGKARIETAGNIVFCFLMTSVSFILVAFSAQELATHSKNDPSITPFHLPSVIAVGIAFTTKLALFLYCWALRNTYSQIRILWEDHRNDLLINGFGLLTSVLGSKVKWWLDPAGAICLSIIIATLWLRTAYSEFQLLIGVTADPNTLQLITYISMTHSPLHITGIDTVRAWHSGPRLVVEVDVVMDAEMSLRQTHDIAEELQMKIEMLPNVERAYVHTDFETTHKPEHFLKKEL